MSATNVAEFVSSLAELESFVAKEPPSAKHIYREICICMYVCVYIYICAYT